MSRWSSSIPLGVQQRTRQWATSGPLLVKGYLRDSVVRTSAYIMSNTVITSALGYVYWIIAAHSYTPAAVGFAAALVSAITIISAATNLGLQSSLVQNLPGMRGPADWSLTITTAFVVSCSASLIAGLVLAALLPIFSSHFALLSDDWRYAATFVAGAVLTTMLTMFDYTSIAERKTRNMLARNSLFAIVKLPLLLLPAIIALGALGVFGSWVGAQLLTAFIGYIFIRRLRNGAFTPRLRGLVAHTRSLVRNMLGHHLINLGSYLPIYILPILVTIRVSAADNAYFYATWRIASFLFLIPPAVGMALFAEGSHDARAIAARAKRALFAIGGVMAPIILIGGAGAHLMLSTFGSAYADHGTTLMRLFLLAEIPDSINNILLNTLRVQRRLAFAATVTLIVGALTLGLGWIFIGMFGINGGAIAILCAETLGCTIIGADLLVRRTGIAVHRASTDGAAS